MKKLTAVTALITALMISVTASAMDEHGKKHEAKKAQETCPVMGGKINKSLYADVNGHRVYVCCKGCISTIKKDPDKYIKVLKDKGETVAKVQEKCPVMGGKINKKLYADVNGKRIYVCCPGCVGKIKADPDNYIKALEDQSVALDAAPATKHQKNNHDSHSGHNH